MGLGRATGNALRLTLRTLVAIAVAGVCLLATSALMVVLNTVLYGQAVHVGLSVALTSLKPLVGGAPLLLLVPPCGAALGGAKLGGDNVWERTVAAALIGGALVAMMAGPMPGPYVHGFRDSDIVSRNASGGR
mmetsp:Transcript_104704/g.276710  ORF Transcript_104704/g.276710 Transcript_104704/m.276710 type:complete len:133 (-) Transcript_104704:20-418(-)